MKKPLATMVLLALAGAGCGSDFDPPSYLSGLRVLALVAEPVEAGPQDQVSIKPYVFVPENSAITQEKLSFCPFSQGAQAAFSCAVPQCEKELTLDSEKGAQARPFDLLLDCLSSTGGSADNGVPTDIPQNVEVLYRYRVETGDGENREAVFRQVLWTKSEPPTENRNPAFEGVRFGGKTILPEETADAVPRDGQVEIRISVDEESLDDFTDSSERARREDAVVWFFSTAGRFEFDQAVGTDVSVTWKAEKLTPQQDIAKMYFVLRDLRGGQAVTGPYLVPISK